MLERSLRRIDSIINSMTGLGGVNDKGARARPALRTALSTEELTSLYRTNGYARRIIDSVPADATRKGWRIDDETGDPDPLADEEQRLAVRQRLREAQQWGRLYGGAIVLMVTEDDIPDEHRRQPAKWLAEPLDLKRVKRVTNLVVLSCPYEATPEAYEPDVRSPSFRNALRWRLSPSSAAGVLHLSDAAIVHASRVLYFAGAELPPHMRYQNGGIDESILEAMWDQVRNLTSVEQGAATLAQEFKVNVLKIDGLAEKSTSDQAALFDLRMKAMAQSLGLLNMVIVGEGEQFGSQGASVTGMKELSEIARGGLCAVTGMPATKLFGEAPGGLNADGESQEGNWTDVIRAYQVDRMQEPITRLSRVLYAQQMGPTKGIEPKHWKVEFNPLDEPTETEKAALRKMHAETDAIVVQAGILPPEHIAASRYGDKGYQHELLPYEVPDEAETDRLLQEARAQAAAEEAAAGGAPGAPGARGTPRGDAWRDTAVFSFHVPESLHDAWQAAANAAGLCLDMPMDPADGVPHVTVLYVGDVVMREMMAVKGGAEVTATAARPMALRTKPGISVFPPGPDGTPIVLEIESAELDALNEQLLRRVADLVSKPQFPEYRAHITLGYYPGVPDEKMVAALAAARPPLISWTAERLLMFLGRDLSASIPLGPPPHPLDLGVPPGATP